MDGLKPILVAKYSELYQLCARNGIGIQFTSGYRSSAEQDALYAKGRTLPGEIVTNAKGGQSLHNFGVAFDIVLLTGGQPDWSLPAGAWNRVGDLGATIGLEHGDRGYVDLPHFQMMMGYSLQDFQNGTVDWTKWEIHAPAAQPDTAADPSPVKDIQPSIAEANPGSAWQRAFAYFLALFTKTK